MLKYLVIASLAIAGCGKKVETKDRIVDLAEYSAFKDVQNLDDPELANAANAVVKVADSTGSGTGFFIDGTGKLMTNNHVVGVKNCPASGCFITIYQDYQVGKEFKDGIEVFAVPVRVDAELDASVLQLYESDKKTAYTSPAFVTVADVTGIALLNTTVHLIGHPGGGLKKWVEGDVFDVYGDWVEADYFSIPGTSGSPVFNGDGQVVGLNHRVSGDETSLTENDFQQSAYFSHGASLQPLLKGEGAGLALVDFEAFRSSSEIVAEDSALYNARQFKVKVVGTAQAAGVAPTKTETTVLAALGEACDQGLADQTFESPTEFDAGLSECKAAMKWLNCVAEELAKAPHKQCPTGEDRKAWEARFAKMSEKFRGFWKNRVDYTSTRTAGIFLSDDKEKAKVIADAYKAELDRVNPPINPGLAGEIYTRIGLSHYGGVSVVEYLKNYDDHPNYNRYAYNIFNGLYWIYKDKLMTADELRFELMSLVDDGSVPIGDKLDLEVVAWENGLL